MIYTCRPTFHVGSLKPVFFFLTISPVHDLLKIYGVNLIIIPLDYMYANNLHPVKNLNFTPIT
jgi:hypothetical protein